MFAAAIATTACGWSTPEPSHADFSVPPSDELPAVCQAGVAEPNATDTPLAHVMREPGAYLGKVVRVRGTLVLLQDDGFYLYDGVERVRLELDDPTRPIGLASMDSTACGHLPVDVEGTPVIADRRAPATIEMRVRSVRTAPRDMRSP